MTSIEKNQDKKSNPTRRAAAALIGGALITMGGLRFWKELGREAEALKKFIEAEDRLTAAVFGREWLSRKHTETTTFIRSAEGRQILESGSDTEIESLLLSLSGVLQEEVVESDMDPAKHFDTFPTLQVTESALGSINNPIESSRIFGIELAPDHGNGARVAEDLLLSCEHVTRERRALYTDSHMDITISTITTSEERTELGKAPILQFTSASPNDLLGSRVTVVGIDKDSMSLKDGTKRFTSLMVPVTPRVVKLIKEKFASHGPEFSILWEKALTDTHIIGTHPGSWIYMEKNFHNEEGPNMSGSPALLDNGDIAGVLHSGLVLKINGALFGFALVRITPDILQRIPETIAARLRIAKR